MEEFQINYTVHRAQAAVLQDPHRFVTVVSGRRFGKTVLQLLRILTKTLEPWSGRGTRPTVLAVCPNHPQTRSVMFNPFLDLCVQLFGDRFETMATVNKTRMSVDFGPRFPVLRFSGAHAGAAEGLRGLKLTHCSVDEAKDVSWQFLNKVIFPALADLQGTALFTGTPAGRSNTLYRLWATDDPDFSRHNYSSYANTLIPGFHESLDKLRELLTPEDFKTEILARFTDTAGTYYTAFKPAHHVCSLPFSGRVLSWVVGFDPGPRNRGWTILAQLADGSGQNYQLAHAERQSESDLDTSALSQIAQQLSDLRNKFGGKVLFVAVDPSRPDLVTHLRKQRQAGVKAVNSFDHGIGVVNTLFHQNRLKLSKASWVDGSDLSWFAEQVQDYHRQSNSLGETLDKEADDIPTHTLDGLRYAVATLDKFAPNFLGLADVLPSAKPSARPKVLA